MGTLKIERVGGFAGFGVSGSKLTSRGEQAVSALSADDRAAVDALFDDPERHQKSGLERDSFRYRITRIAKGKNQTVEVPETAVPAALKACVTDKLT
jgi:hypothetical protein